MIYRISQCNLSRWRSFFHACRTAVRTEAGLSTAEFLLPPLVLDRICFGSPQDRLDIRSEIIQVLSFSEGERPKMDQTQRQRAVNLVFSVFDTLKIWAEGFRERSKAPRVASRRSRSEGNGQDMGDPASRVSWSPDETVEKIEDFFPSIPLDLQARAAATVGMNARALLLLEMEARARTVEEIFEWTTERQNRESTFKSYRFGFTRFAVPTESHVDVNLMKNIFATLGDSDALSGIGAGISSSTILTNIKDSIRQNEASGKFEAALQGYERAFQIKGEERNPQLLDGLLQCLLELGRFDTVLSRAASVVQPNEREIRSSVGVAASLGVEAAWRLGRWETLEQLLSQKDGKEPSSQNVVDAYRVCTGRALLSLERKDSPLFVRSLKEARDALMRRLSTVARESYSRSYPELVGLHCLREIENAHEHSFDASLSLSEVVESGGADNWAWQGRLNLTSPAGASEGLARRIALTRIRKDPVLEGSLLLNSGKRARKRGLHALAENLFSQAQLCFSTIPALGQEHISRLGSLVNDVTIQVAKLRHELGDSNTALKLLGVDSMQQVIDEMLQKAENTKALIDLAVSYEKQLVVGISGEPDRDLSHRFAKRLLRLTRWMVEGGLKGGGEIIGRFKIIHKLSSKWEKGKNWAELVISVP